MEREQPDLRRRINDDRRRAFGGETRLIAFVCECVDPECRATVALNAADFDERRPGPLVHPLHASPATDVFPAPPEERGPSL